MKEMVFSYSIDNNPILEHCEIACTEGQCLLMLGSENKAFTIFGAIIGRILPCMEIPDLESLHLLYKDFNGILSFEKDSFPIKTSYIGTDPDRHLIFDEVWEEYFAKLHISNLNKILPFLNNFSLGEDYLYRKIYSLSGGEKMKLALSLAFAEDNPLIVLHGIIPWLDNQGRLDLIKLINDSKNSNKIIIILEQEYHCLESVIDKVLFLNSKNLELMDKNEIFKLKFEDNFINEFNKLNTLYSGKASELVLNCDKLAFYYKDDITHQKKEIFKNLKLNLYQKKIYCLMGDNGAGKSSLANLIFKQEKAQQGKIELLGKDINCYTQIELNKIICFVAQFPENQLIWNTLGDCRRRINESQLDFTLELFNTYFPMSDAYPLAYLSFSELKSLILITNLNANSKLLLLDEPTWSMDIKSLENFIHLLNIISEKLDLCILMISHAQNLLPLLAAKNLFIEDLVIREAD